MQSSRYARGGVCEGLSGTVQNLQPSATSSQILPAIASQPVIRWAESRITQDVEVRWQNVSCEVEK
jgi:hypothetical protein